jgi:hypothetical protein
LTIHSIVATDRHQPSTRAPTPLWIPLVLALVALLPVPIILPALGRLYFFGDDWNLLAEYVDAGLGPWLLRPFAENFAPLFKVVWLAAVMVGGGSYLPLLLLLWIIHAANVLLVGLLLRRTGLGPIATAAALIAFGLSWTNLESLTWAPQLSQLLSVSLFLLAWIFWHRAMESKVSSVWAVLGMLGCSLASGITFARGVIVGAVLALYGFGEAFIGKHRPIWSCLVGGALASAAITFAVTLHFADGKIRSPGELGPLAMMTDAIYAASYLALNPLLLLGEVFPWFEVGSPSLNEFSRGSALAALSSATLILLLAAITIVLVKAGTIAIGLKVSTASTRLVLLTLLAFDVGNAAILGMGRSELGFGTAFSSRYQYVSWLTFAPFLGIAIHTGVDALASRFRRPVSSYRLFAALSLAILVLIVATPWPSKADRWAEWRGTEIRQAVQTAPADSPLSYSLITVGRARELVKLFNLH